jgi:hypothetical protein
MSERGHDENLHKENSIQANEIPTKYQRNR